MRIESVSFENDVRAPGASEPRGSARASRDLEITLEGSLVVMRHGETRKAVPLHRVREIMFASDQTHIAGVTTPRGPATTAPIQRAEREV